VEVDSNQLHARVVVEEAAHQHRLHDGEGTPRPEAMVVVVGINRPRGGAEDGMSWSPGRLPRRHRIRMLLVRTHYTYHHLLFLVDAPFVAHITVMFMLRLHLLMRILT
jgi:hypothetical protein